MVYGIVILIAFIILGGLLIEENQNMNNEIQNPDLDDDVADIIN